jgi:hypothetical protein
LVLIVPSAALPHVGVGTELGAPEQSCQVTVVVEVPVTAAVKSWVPPKTTVALLGATVTATVTLFEPQPTIKPIARRAAPNFPNCIPSPPSSLMPKRAVSNSISSRGADCAGLRHD